MNIQVNTKAKAYVKESILIDAPIEKVYSLVKNIKNWPQWLEGITEVNIDPNPGENSVFIWKAKGYKIKSKIHTIRPASEIGWTGKVFWINAVHNWYFTEPQKGTTKVTSEESFSGLGSSLMKNSLQNDMLNSLHCLKKEAEKNKN